MKVIAAINGTIISENSALYALHYAKELEFTLVLLHVKNRKDSIEDVEKSFSKIEQAAKAVDVNIERVILEGAIEKTIKSYIKSTFVDTLFCSTRKHYSFFANSFSKLLIKSNFPINIAVVHIVHINNNDFLESIILPIKESKLSVKKFTFFAVMAKAYEAKGEIYSITTMSKNRMALIDIGVAKEMLGAINLELKHYLKLASIIGFNLNIKHQFTMHEESAILEHIVKSNHKLSIIGAKRLSFFSTFLRREPIEDIMQNSSINTIAYYPKED